MEPTGIDPDRQAPFGLAGAAVLVVALAGIYLWLSMVVAPWQLASGLLDAKDHLERAEKKLEQGATKEARYETLAAVGASGRAREGLRAGGPLMDLAESLPVIGDALGEVDHLVAAAEYSAAAAEGTLDVAQNALRGPDKLIIKDPDDKDGGSQIRLDRVEAIGEVISGVRSDIAATKTELEAVDLSNLPERARPSIRDAIKKARDTDKLLADAEAGFDILPGILGADGPRTYLLGFQNNAEQRGTGGAVLQFRVLQISAGKPALIEDLGEKVYDVDQDREQISIPLPEDAWYVAGVPDAQRFGNSNWSPDWPFSAQLMLDYAAATPGTNFPEVDGAIAVDPVLVQQLMPGVGAYHTGKNKSGHRISAERIVHFVLYKAYATYPITAYRRDVLGKVVNGFYGKLFRPDHPTELVEGLGEGLRTKHMQIWMREPGEQRFIERMNWDGAIEPAPKDDYLFVVEQNVGGNKLDYFDSNSTSVSVEVDGSDALVSTELKVLNGVFLPQPRWSMGDTGRPGRGTVHRPMLNLYVQPEATLSSASVTGSIRVDTPPGLVTWTGDVPAEHSELGKKVWSGTLEVKPGEEGGLRFDYRVPGVVRELKGRKVYRLHVQHQPKVRPERLTVEFQLPAGARAVKAKGWKRDGDVLLWDKDLKEDIILEVAWRE